MKLHRFFIEQPLGEEIVVKEKSLLHQWNNVLRFKKSENLILFNSLQNTDFIYSILDINKKEVILKLKEKKKNLTQREGGRKINLCISLIKKDNLDLILEKCTELGVSEFTPIVSERVEKKNKASWNRERGEKIIKEAVEQSGWGSVPRLHDSIKLEDLLIDIKKKGEIENVIIADMCSDFTNPSQEGVDPTYLVIGPEGGWTDNERGMFKNYKLKTVSFGKSTLRAETAAIVGCFEMMR